MELVKKTYSWVRSGKMFDSIEKFSEKIFNLFEKQFYLFLCASFAISLILRLLFAHLDDITLGDAFIYVRNAIQITQGNWTPPLSYGSGWSVVLAFFIMFTPSATIYQDMVVGIVLYIVFEALTIFPLGLAAEKLFARKWAVLVVIFYAVWIPERVIFTPGSSETLFVFLLMLSFYFLLLAREKWMYLNLAMAISGFISWIRANGIFVYICLAICFFLMVENKKFGLQLKRLLISSLFFLATATPYLILRTIAFGSPFEYGPNSNLFLDVFWEVWSPNYLGQGSSIFNYLTTHSLSAIFKRFFVGGVFDVLYHFFILVVPAILLAFFLVGLFKSLNKKHLVLPVFIAVFLICWMPLYDLIGKPRFLLVLMPLILIVSVLGMSKLLKNVKKRPQTIKAIVAIAVIATFLYVPFQDRFSSQSAYNLLYQQDKDELVWGKWIDANCPNSTIVFALYGASVPMANLNDTELVTNYSQGAMFYSPSRNITIMVSGYFTNLSDGVNWLKKVKATHFEVDSSSPLVRPWTTVLMNISTPINRIVYGAPQFTLIYSNFNTSSTYKVMIYAFNRTM